MLSEQKRARSSFSSFFSFSLVLSLDSTRLVTWRGALGCPSNSGKLSDERADSSEFLCCAGNAREDEAVHLHMAHPLLGATRIDHKIIAKR